MKVDDDFDFNGFNKAAVFEIVEKGDKFFQEKLYENNLLICRIDRADIYEFEEITGKSALEEAKRIIRSHSTDGTLESGLEVIAKMSKLNDGPSYVGYLLIKEMRERRERE